VTVLRSPSGGSASSLAAGAAARALGAEPPGAAAPSAVAHCPQNLNCGGFSARHFAQILTIGAAQLPQNFIPAGLSRPHREQVIAGFLAELLA